MIGLNPVTWMFIIFIVPLAVAIVAYLAVQVYLRIRQNKQTHVNTVESSDGRRFALYFGFGSPGVTAWYVYELGKSETPAHRVAQGQTPVSLLFVSRFMDMIDPLEQGAISLHADRHLVFEREGIYFSLYDTKKEELLVHEADTQAQYSAWAEKESGASEFNEEDYLQWVKQHLHKPIAAILEGA